MSAVPANPSSSEESMEAMLEDLLNRRGNDLIGADLESVVPDMKLTCRGPIAGATLSPGDFLGKKLYITATWTAVKTDDDTGWQNFQEAKPLDMYLSALSNLKEEADGSITFHFDFFGIEGDLRIYPKGQNLDPSLVKGIVLPV